MAFSYSWYKKEVSDYLKVHFTPDSKILDVGAGEGTYYNYLHDWFKHMDAVEIFKPNIVNYKLEQKYHKVYNIDIKDFMEMSDEEIEFSLYTFKVGDKVVTDDGRVGIITDICTCDSCKKRGFYEPKVKLEVGIGDIWITDTCKNNGFINFYSIGDQVFGNIDEKCFDRIKEQISERKRELVELEAQLNVIQSLKEAEDI
jgi:uncharacterized protein (UPF0218 family)